MKLNILIIIASLSNNALAVMGNVLSQQQLPKGVCALYAKDFRINPSDTSKGDVFYCSATLISPQYAITAGHCLKKYYLKSVRKNYYPQASIGEIELVCKDSDGSIKKSEVDTMIPHPNYVFKGATGFEDSISESMDLSIIKLKSTMHAPAQNIGNQATLNEGLDSDTGITPKFVKTAS